jgi:hypothetical protein
MMANIKFINRGRIAEGTMSQIDENSVADVVFQLRWNSEYASHNECYAARSVNLWRDWLPDRVLHALMGTKSWAQTSLTFSPGELFGNHGDALVIDRRRFSLTPKTGRFYPQGRLAGLPGVFPQNMQPFRCVGVNNGHMEIDLSHPLAQQSASLLMTVGQTTKKAYERGGSSEDWVGRLADGPGMQIRWQDRPTDFFSGHPFSRRDDRPDGRFYSNPRLVHHVDETARDMIGDIYKRFVREGMVVLDLMSSWTSHLPDTVIPASVYGLGLNRTEMEQNPRLSDVRVHDLNIDPLLPYEDQRFDAVICSLSIEYLTQPLMVFKEAARVLKPGGVFVLTLSNRWFPPKVIAIWEQIHEFERMGLVLEYFIRSGGFGNLGTYSMRGLPRPRNDKYAGEIALSDPVYAVWGTRLDNPAP